MRTHSPTHGAAVVELLARLPSMSRGELLDLWCGYFEQPPPKAASRSLLERAVAYAMQERQFGGLSSRTRRDLRRIAKSGHMTRSGQAKLSGADDICSTGRPDRAKAPGELLRPGMRLVREWQGRRHIVDVRDDGFLWNDKVYRSLSSVASEITGAKWSGPRFFRL